MSPIDFNLLFIGDRRQCNNRPLIEVLRLAAEAGIGAFQFREKDLTPREQLALASKLIPICKQNNVKFLVNDRVDLAMALDADGVHLPESGLPIQVARSLLGPDKLIGVSCHALKSVLHAEQEGADYAVLGPVYETPSKRGYGAPLGLDAFRKIRNQIKMPLFALGGINLSRISEVMSAGSDGIALVSAISKAENIRKLGTRILAVTRTEALHFRDSKNNDVDKKKETVV